MHRIASWMFRRKVETQPVSDEAWDALFASAPAYKDDTAWVGVERRKRPRFGHEQVCQVYVDLSPLGQQRVFARTRDVSETGVSFVHAQRVEPGKHCAIAFMTPDQQLLHRKAVVASCRRHDSVFVIGLHFDKPINPRLLLHEASEAA